MASVAAMECGKKRFLLFWEGVQALNTEAGKRFPKPVIGSRFRRLRKSSLYRFAS